MSKSKIYEQHDAAFKNVSAFVILKGDKRVATVAFKFPADGAGRLYAYIHWIGLEMVRGMAGGYGYDKKSAACEVAAKVALNQHADEKLECEMNRVAFFSALKDIDGSDWSVCLRDAGFSVVQAV